MSHVPELTVVVPLYNEQENLPELHLRLTRTLTDLGIDYELILVNDGSRDASGAMLDAIAASDPRATVMHLSRNFGHQAALSAGIDAARGDGVVLMDGDLQDPPEVLEQLLAAWRDGNDVVYAIRTRRKEGLGKRLAYALFYRILRFTSDLEIPLDSGDFCLMDRKVVETLKSLPERQRFVRGLRAFVGFRQIGVAVERDARHAGTPKYTFRSLVRLAVDGLVSFSGFPLTLVTYLGVFSLLVALVLTGWIVVDVWGRHGTLHGWASTMTVVLYVGSIQLLSLGIIAEYLRRIFLEVKGRPTYVVSRVSRQGQEAASTRRRPSRAGHSKCAPTASS